MYMYIYIYISFLSRALELAATSELAGVFAKLVGSLHERRVSLGHKTAPSTFERALEQKMATELHDCVSELERL